MTSRDVTATLEFALQASGCDRLMSFRHRDDAATMA